MNDTWLISIGSAIVVTLLAGMKILWDRMNLKDSEHREERKEWYKKLEELVMKQNQAIETVGKNHDEALDDLSAKYDKRQGEINETMLTAFKQAFNKNR